MVAFFLPAVIVRSWLQSSTSSLAQMSPQEAQDESRQS